MATSFPCWQLRLRWHGLRVTIHPSEKYPCNFQNVDFWMIYKMRHFSDLTYALVSIQRRRRVVPALLLLIVSSYLVPVIGLGFGTMVGQSRQPSRGTSSSLHHDQAALISTVDVSKLSIVQFQSNRDQIGTGLSTSSLGRIQSYPSRVPAVTFAGTGSSTVSVLSSFDGYNQLQSAKSAFPPDVQVAAGPTSIVEMVNSNGEVFSKQGAALQVFPLSSFFGTGSAIISDPKILYDGSSSRWFASILTCGTPNSLLLAASMGNDPTGTWNVYSISTGTFLPDQPLLGLSDDKVVLTANDFPGPCLGPGAFVGAQIWTFTKSQLISGAPLLDFVSIGPLANVASIFPVASLSSTTTQYLVSSGDPDLGPSGTVALYSITEVPPSAVSLTTTGITVSQINVAPAANQLGSANTIDTGDYRVLDAVWYQGNLWLALNEGCTPPGDTAQRSCIRLIEINTNNNTKMQDFDLATSGYYYFYPSLNLDNLGNMLLIYGFSAQTTSTCCYPSLGVSGQSVSDSLNSLSPLQTLKSGSAPDATGQVSSRPRYGDYFGAGRDPTNTTVIWVAGEYHNSVTGDCFFGGSDVGNCWSTFVGSITDQPGFALSGSPSYLDTASGSSGQSQVSVSSLGGFSGTVSLAASTSIVGPTVSLTPSTVSIPQNGLSTLTVNVPSSLAAGTTFIITIVGTSGSVSHPTTITLTVGGVQDFSVNVTPTVIAIGQSSTATLSLVLGSNQGFVGSILLTGASIPSGLNFGFLFSPVSLKASFSTLSTFTIVTSTTTPGLYSATVTATSGALSHSVSIRVAVTPISFSLGISTTFAGVQQPNDTIVSTGTLGMNSPSSTLALSGTISVLVTDTASGNAISSASYAISNLGLQLQSDGSAKVVLLLNASALPAPLAVYGSLVLSAPTVSAPGASGTSLMVARNADAFGFGAVNLQDVGFIENKFGCSMGQSCYDLRADLFATGSVTLQDAGVATAYFGALDFNSYLYVVSAIPASLTIPKGSLSMSTLSITNVNFNSFAGTVALSITSSDPGVNAVATPASIVGAGSSALAITVGASTQTGSYTITVATSSGPITHSIVLSISVTVPTPDFGLAASPLVVNVRFGESSTSALTVSSLAGFSGNVAVSVPSPFTGLTLSLSSSSVSVSSGGSGSLTLTASASTMGSFTTTVTGISGSISHSVRLVINVGDFLLSASIPNGVICITTGHSTTLPLMLIDLNSGMTVSLSLTVSPSHGLSAALSPTSVVLSPDGQGTSTLSLTGSNQGSYTVAVTGTSGSLTHTLDVPITVGRVC